MSTTASVTRSATRSWFASPSWRSGWCDPTTWSEELGGEEFVWLLPGVNSAEGARLAERLRDAIHGQSGEGGLPPVTISLGLASRRGDEDAEAILARADAALYAAKNGGRNQVQLAA